MGGVCLVADRQSQIGMMANKVGSLIRKDIFNDDIKITLLKSE